MDGSSSVSTADVDLLTVLDRMADAVFAVDGLHLWESIPDAVDAEFYDRYHDALGARNRRRVGEGVGSPPTIDDDYSRLLPSGAVNGGRARRYTVRVMSMRPWAVLPAAT